MSFIPFFILKTVYEESFYLKRSARVLVVPLLSFRTYARNPPVSEPEMELVISNEYEEFFTELRSVQNDMVVIPEACKESFLLLFLGGKDVSVTVYREYERCRIEIKNGICLSDISHFICNLT